MDRVKVARVLLKIAKELNASVEREAKFPSKAMDVNKLPDTDGFWDWDIKEANRMTGMSLRPKTVGDVIFWLNMVGGAWEKQAKKKKKK